MSGQGGFGLLEGGIGREHMGDVGHFEQRLHVVVRPDQDEDAFVSLGGHVRANEGAKAGFRPVRLG